MEGELHPARAPVTTNSHLSLHGSSSSPELRVRSQVVQRAPPSGSREPHTRLRNSDRPVTALEAAN